MAIIILLALVVWAIAIFCFTGRGDVFFMDHPKFDNDETKREISKETKAKILGGVLVPIGAGLLIIAFGMHLRADWTPWFLGIYSIVVSVLSLSVFIYTRIKKWKIKKKLKQYMKEVELQQKMDIVKQNDKDEGQN